MDGRDGRRGRRLVMCRAALRGILFCLLLAGVSRATLGQSFVLDLPDPSQRSEVSQRIGLTDITIAYHRPLAGDRKIWGGLVPYGKVWRAGANENSTNTFSDPLVIEGKPVDKGTYGLHRIRNVDDSTIIFSKSTAGCGSFSYEESDDALRGNVNPRANEMHNALT